MKGSFADKVRTAFLELGAGGREVTLDDLLRRAMIKTYKDRKKVTLVMRDLVKAGDAMRVADGVWQPTEKVRPVERREAMLRIIRARKAVTVADLQELCGVTEPYAKEFLGLLMRKGLVRYEKEGPKHGPGRGKYRLVKDLQKVPGDEDKAKRLREIRKRKKAEALAALDRAGLEILNARMAISELEEE